MSCHREADVAAYVLDALEPEERASVAAHLRECAVCTRTLTELGTLPALLARFHMQQMGSPLFEFSSNQDYGDSSRVIAFASAGGLGLPDRDYYFKDDPKSKETRDKYLEHVAKTFELAGWDAAKAKSAADTIMKMETARSTPSRMWSTRMKCSGIAATIGCTTQFTTSHTANR